VVGAYDLPSVLPEGSDFEELVEIMGRDKKALTGLTFVLDGPSGVEVVPGVERSAIDTALERVR
jgi:5-deoxy-5-amino-3-dehydroquinate synthase